MRPSGRPTQPASPTPPATLTHVPTTASRLRFLHQAPPVQSSQHPDSQQQLQNVHADMQNGGARPLSDRQQHAELQQAAAAAAASIPDSGSSTGGLGGARTPVQHMRGSSPSQHQPGDASTSDSWYKPSQPQGNGVTVSSQQTDKLPEEASLSPSMDVSRTQGSDFQRAGVFRPCHDKVITMTQ